METYSDKIKFYFDKNIWSDITNMSDVERKSFDALIKPLKEQSRVCIYYSPIGVLESINGISLETHYEICREELRLADRITDKHFLEYPWDHVRRSADYFLKKPFKEPALVFLRLFREIVTSPYRQIEPKIGRTRKMLVRWLKEWSDSLNSIKLSFSHLDQHEAKKFKEDAYIKRRKEKHWNPFCQQFSLPQELKNLPFDEANAKFHSFRYCVDYRIAYENKVLFDNKKARPSDYFDWIQIVYLNIMDYLVTNDSQLTTILKECKNSELNKVSMRFSEFLDCLDEGRLPPRRAPDPIFEKWYPAK